MNCGSFLTSNSCGGVNTGSVIIPCVRNARVVNQYGPQETLSLTQRCWSESLWNNRYRLKSVIYVHPITSNTTGAALSIGDDAIHSRVAITTRESAGNSQRSGRPAINNQEIVLATLRKLTKPVGHPWSDPPRRIRVAEISATAWEARAVRTSSDLGNRIVRGLSPERNSAHTAGHHSSAMTEHHSSDGEAQMPPHPFPSEPRKLTNGPRPVVGVIGRLSVCARRLPDLHTPADPDAVNGRRVAVAPAQFSLGERTDEALAREVCLSVGGVTFHVGPLDYGWARQAGVGSERSSLTRSSFNHGDEHEEHLARPQIDTNIFEQIDHLLSAQAEPSRGGCSPDKIESAQPAIPVHRVRDGGPSHGDRIEPCWPSRRTRQAGCELPHNFHSGDGPGIHQPRSAVQVKPCRQGRARERVICPAVTRFKFRHRGTRILTFRLGEGVDPLSTRRDAGDQLRGVAA